MLPEVEGTQQWEARWGAMHPACHLQRAAHCRLGPRPGWPCAAFLTLACCQHMRMPAQVGKSDTLSCATNERVCSLFTCASLSQVWAGERALPVRASLLEVCTDQQLLPQMLDMQARGASEATAAAMDLTGTQTRVQLCQ